MLYGRAAGQVFRCTPPNPIAIERLGWERLLAFLAASDDGARGAGAAYEAVRERLVRFFRAKGAVAAEELADATFERVARKLAADERLMDVSPAYVFGVARLIYRESLRKERTHRRGVERLAHTPEGDDDGTSTTVEENMRVWQRLLDELAPADKSLLMSYYEGSGQPRIHRRQELVRHLGIKPGLLRARVHRLRLQLERRAAELQATDTLAA
jgi:hypothetical protein